MLHPLHLRLTRLDGGAVHVGVGEGAQATGVVPAEVVRTWSAPARPAAGVAVVPGRDTAMTANEERVGRALGEVFRSSSEVASRVASWLGEAAGRGARALLVVDAKAPLDALPWELVAWDGAPLETTGRAVVARVVDGRPPGMAAPPGVALFAPGEDAESGNQAARVSAVARAQGYAVWAGATARRLVHLVAHGQPEGDRLAIAMRGGEADAASVVASLGPDLPGVALVVLDTCHGGALVPASLATRLVRSGAQAVLAPDDRIAVGAAGRLADALFPALAAGRDIAEAVADARRHLAAAGMAHPSWRWHAWKLTVAVADAASARVPVVASPGGFPAAKDDAAALLHRAVALAQQGWLGVEHVLLASEGLGGVAGLVAAMCKERVAAHLSHVKGSASPQPVLTPRLAALAAQLPEPFGVTELWASICREPGHVLPLLTGADLGSLVVEGSMGFSTLGPREQQATGNPGLAAEYVGGPCDGLLFHWAPGPVGRWDPTRPGQAGLYAGAVAWDQSVSRHHLDVTHAHRIVLRGPAVLRRLGQERTVRGPLDLVADDLLRLGQATWLRIV